MSKVLSVLLSSACIAFSSLSHSATTLISFDDIAIGWPGFVPPPAYTRYSINKQSTYHQEINLQHIRP